MIIELGSKRISINLDAVKNYTYEELSKVYHGDVLAKIAKASGVKKTVKKESPKFKIKNK